ncbi:hypothetical protein MR578_10605, partial [bacterium]|nr:hypothetical protein [bacterium]
LFWQNSSLMSSIQQPAPAGKVRRALVQRVGNPDTLQKGDPSGTASPDRPVPPFEIPLDKILREIAHSSLRSPHPISRKISLSV